MNYPSLSLDIPILSLSLSPSPSLTVDIPIVPSCSKIFWRLLYRLSPDQLWPRSRKLSSNSKHQGHWLAFSQQPQIGRPWHHGYTGLACGKLLQKRTWKSHGSHGFLQKMIYHGWMQLLGFCTPECQNIRISMSSFWSERQWAVVAMLFGCFWHLLS